MQIAESINPQHNDPQKKDAEFIIFQWLEEKILVEALNLMVNEMVSCRLVLSILHMEVFLSSAVEILWSKKGRMGPKKNKTVTWQELHNAVMRVLHGPSVNFAPVLKDIQIQ